MSSDEDYVSGDGTSGHVQNDDHGESDDSRQVEESDSSEDEVRITLNSLTKSFKTFGQHSA